MINTVINDDCRDVIKKMDDNSVDVVVLDPFFQDYIKFYDMINEDIPRILKNDGRIIAFSNRPHTGYLQVELDNRFRFLTEVVWNFADGRWVSNKLPRICHENILIYTNAKKNTLNDMRVLEWIEKPKQSKKGGANIGKWEAPKKDRVYTPEDFAQLESVIYLPRGVGKVGGVVAKPEQLIELLLLVTSSEGETILDAFSGTGNVSRVAKKLGRNYIAIEIEEDKYRMAKERIEEVI